MMRLKSKLLSLNANKSIETKIYSPANTEELRIPFRADKTAKVVGKLAQITPPDIETINEDHLLSGVLVQNDFKLSLMAPEDLREYTGLTTTTIMCRQRINLGAAGFDLIRWALEGSFGSVEDISARHERVENGQLLTNGNGIHDAADEEIERKQQSFTYLVLGCIRVHYENNGEVTVEWEGNAINDGIADAVVAVLLRVESTPAAVKGKKPFFSHYGFEVTLNSFVQNHLKITYTITRVNVRIPTPASRHKIDLSNYACFWKPILDLQ
jgi:cleavage and polyadenylation specificity factor subunit 3